MQERAFQVDELTKTEGWLYLTDFVKSMLAPKQRSLLNGDAKSLEAYRELVGWVKGVTFVLSANETLQEQVQSAIKRGEGDAEG